MASSERTGAYRPITIQTLDESVRSFFDTIVDPHVVSQTEESRKVPVVFASGERWVTAKDRRGIRDKNGRIILPVMSVRRTGIDPVATMAALGVKVPRIQIARRVSEKTAVVQDAIAARQPAARGSRGRVVYDVTTIPYPDISVTSYEVVVQAQYIGQMNQILQKFLGSLESNVGVPTFTIPIDGQRLRPADVPAASEDEVRPLDGYYFVAFVDPNMGDSGNFDEFTDVERIVKYSFSFRVPTYLHLDEPGMQPAVRVERTAFMLDFGDEAEGFVDDPLELELIFGR